METIDEYLDSIANGDPISATPELSVDNTTIELDGKTYCECGKTYVGPCTDVMGTLYRNKTEEETGTFEDVVILIGEDKFVKRDLNTKNPRYYVFSLFE